MKLYFIDGVAQEENIKYKNQVGILLSQWGNTENYTNRLIDRKKGEVIKICYILKLCLFIKLC